jgi:alpha-N-arabinofuranosidase
VHRASIVLDPHDVVAPVHRRTFGSFVEHLGRCVYTGIFEPDHPSADEDGFRTDVLALVRELGVTTVRYPGGNFVSSYRWEDGIGPVADRPARLNPAWHTLETNAFGLDEFVRWTGKAGVEPILAINLGTRGIEAALDLLEYANHPAGTRLSDQRLANGAGQPYGIRMWCLGNEMDGPWQIGAMTATEYGKIATRTASAMRRVDPDLRLIACGSSHSAMPTFGSWERDVLTEAYDQVDLISLHAYYQQVGDDLPSFLASAEDMDRFIDQVAAIADAVRAVRRATKTIMIAFDEWNVWYQNGAASTLPSGDDWPVAPPLLEDRYNLADAVVVGNLLISLLRHSDRVAAACQAQLVNVIAPIMTEAGGPAWRQTIFHPFALTSRYARGVVLNSRAASDTITTDRYGEVRTVDSVATWDEVGRSAAVFLVNRATTDEAAVTVELAALGLDAVVECLTLHGPDPYSTNALGEPDRAQPQPKPVELSGTTASVTLPPASWTMLRLGRRDGG